MQLGYQNSNFQQFNLIRTPFRKIKQNFIKIEQPARYSYQQPTKIFLLQSIQETRKASTMDVLEHKATQIEDKFNDMLITYNKKINLVKDELTKIQKLIEQEHTAYEQNLEIRFNEISGLNQKFASKMENEIIERKESEIRIQKLMEEKSASLRTDIAKESKTRQQIFDGLNNSLESDLPKVFEEIQSQSNERENADNQIVKKVTDEVNKINEKIQNEKQGREKTEETIYGMLRDLVNRVKGEIDNERKDREGSEETILNLIEEACNKLSAV